MIILLIQSPIPGWIYYIIWAYCIKNKEMGELASLLRYLSDKKAGEKGVISLGIHFRPYANYERNFNVCKQIGLYDIMSYYMSYYFHSFNKDRNEVYIFRIDPNPGAVFRLLFTPGSVEIDKMWRKKSPAENNMSFS